METRTKIEKDRDQIRKIIAATQYYIIASQKELYTSEKGLDMDIFMDNILSSLKTLEIYINHFIK